MNKRALIAIFILPFIVFTTRAAVSPAEQADFFEQSVRPILAENCYKCHSHTADKLKGGLMLDSLSGFLTGGDSGPALVPGKPDESLFIKAIRYKDDDLQMPPKGKKLASEKIKTLEDWVQMGAPWPGTDAGKGKKIGKITDKDREWWSFQPVRAQTPPKVDDNGWSKNPIDQFIFAKLRSPDLMLSPAPEAPREVLARRLYLNVWGVPPTPKQIDDFVHDESANAYESLVDHLLASPHYGEYLTRQWLDLVRFAESDGYKADGFRPSAWRYRDYVINAFNSDKPYDSFIREQIAGDEIAPEDSDALIAAMFLRHGIYEYNNTDVRLQREGILNELTDVTGDVFLGMGMSCARCHDHKFDPILQKDYYRLQAFYAPVVYRDDAPVGDARTKAEYQRKLAIWEEKTKDIRAGIEAIESDYRVKNLTNAMKKLPDEIQEIILKPVAQRSVLEQELYELAYLQVAPSFVDIDKKLKGAQKMKMEELENRLAEFDSIKPEPLPTAITVRDVGPVAPATYLPKSRNKEDVAPGFLTVLREGPASIKPLSQSSGRRTALADWIASADNPLTARVMVNRVWQRLFGRGIVATASDFGHLGQPPTHPELLDWLTTQFVHENWSVKKIHRLILTSATFRQSSTPADARLAVAKDPENLYLSHINVRRLDADQIRDAILSASGELDWKMGGPSDDSSKPRRTIYTKVRRNTHDPLLQAFDAPDNISSMPQRNLTTTAVQALLMFNSQMILQHAKALADRLENKDSSNKIELVSEAYRLTLGRAPNPNESARAAHFLDQQEERLNRELLNPKPVPFLTENLPAREGKAAIIDQDGLQKRFEAADSSKFPEGDFTIEAIVLVKTAIEEPAIRTIASQWEGGETQPGWAFGVTGKKSYDKPQVLALQLTSPAASGGASETILSDVKLDPGKTYFVAATVHLSDTNRSGITFYAKDMAHDDDPYVTATASHQVTMGIKSHATVTLGSTALGKNQFNGLIDEVRISSSALAPEKFFITTEAPNPAAVAHWQLKSEKDFFRDRSGHGNDLKINVQDTKTLNPRKAAVEDLCHVLLNSNEFLYVD